MKAGTETKLKFKQLQRCLDLALWQARGLLDTLWNFAANNCPAGDIGRFSDEEIAIGIDWRGSPQQLIESLVTVRWLDRHDGARLIVHDWPDHCEDTVHKSLARKAEVFADGTIPHLSRFTQAERAQLVTAYEARYGREAVESGRIRNASKRSRTPKNAPALPSHTKPSHALPSHTNQGAAEPLLVFVDLPPVLDVPEFRTAWSLWEQHRKEKRQKLTPTSTKQQIKDLSEMGAARAIAAISYSIGKGWIGIFEEKRNGQRQLNIGAGQRFDDGKPAETGKL